MLSYYVWVGFVTFAVVDIAGYILRMFRMAFQLPIRDLLRG